MSKKYFFLSIAATTAAMFLFTNMTSFDVQSELSIQQIVRQSQHLSKRIKSKDFSIAGKKMLARQKRAITRYLSMKAKPESCQKLLELDKTLITGTYELFPRGVEVLYHCKVKKGSIVQQIEVANLQTTEPSDN